MGKVGLRCGPRIAMDYFSGATQFLGTGQLEISLAISRSLGLADSSHL